MNSIMKLTKDTKLGEILSKYPWLTEELPKLSEKLKVLASPLGKMMLKNATISDASGKSGLSVETIIQKLTELIRSHQ
ncbi:MAG: DUF1858 domain-containing protein [Eubacteriales bacterium]|nr:DUF1858 domain-containing protein [Eubacteriales bacterium]